MVEEQPAVPPGFTQLVAAPAGVDEIRITPSAVRRRLRLPGPDRVFMF
jgi:hypothetical protein